LGDPRQVMCRQRLLAVRPFVDKEGVAAAGWRSNPGSCWSSRGPSAPSRAGRYLAVADAPRDLDRAAPGARDMPEAMRRELRDLGLL